jgi:hypothetical protein
MVMQAPGAAGQQDQARQVQDPARQITERAAASVPGVGVLVLGIVAGIATIVLLIESRLTRLSYAAEIAQAMLRRQQASAVVGARQRIVEGAVGMVQMALNRLEEEGSSSWTRSARPRWCPTCWSSCVASRRQQVVNTGTLYS